MIEWAEKTEYQEVFFIYAPYTMHINGGMLANLWHLLNSLGKKIYAKISQAQVYYKFYPYKNDSTQLQIKKYKTLFSIKTIQCCMIFLL